jgi:hypothetical protein
VSVRYFRKVIKIKAEDSPNVQQALGEIARGLMPTGTLVVPGVLPYPAYTQRRAMWDEQQQCVGLDAEFWEGAEVLLFPPLWLNTAEMRARALETDSGRRRREAKAIGIDPAEGGDKTAMAAVDEYGLLDLEARKTPNTAEVKGSVIAFARKHGVPPEKWVFDRGGGGKWIADVLREEGFPVRTVGFGETVVADLHSGMYTVEEREEVRESKYAYKNRRAQMYGELSALMDPDGYDLSFAIPARYTELRRQLGLIPKMIDGGGRLYMLPKRGGKPGERCLESIMGCSPDESDALVLAVHGMLHGEYASSAGAL